MTDAELIARLRRNGVRIDQGINQLCDDAADSIEQLVSTNEVLIAERDALMAALAEAREKALREAAEMVRSTAYTTNGGVRSLEPVSAALAGMDMHHATVADAILALIEAPNAR